MSEIIVDAYRQSNLIPIGVTPTDDQNTEALRYLNRIVQATLGNEAGDPFVTMPLGNNGIQRPSGFPWYGNEPDQDWFVPEDTRLMVNLPSSTPLDVFLHPSPNDGARVAVIDVAANFSTSVFTLKGNGRRIEGQTEIVLNTDGFNGEWFYQADMANWVKCSPLTLADTFPFPVEFEFFFIIQLCLALNPSYGISLDPQTQETYRRARSQLRARYSQTIQQRSEYGLTRMSETDPLRSGWGDGWYPFDPSAAFTRGYPW